MKKSTKQIMKKYYIIRSLPLYRDSRVIRYKSFIHDFNSSINFITFEEYYDKDRKGIDKIKIGSKESNKMVAYLRFLFYLFLFSVAKVKKNDILICMDIDVFVPVYFATLFKRSKVYLDIVDPISETKFRGIPFSKFLDFIEWCLLRFRKKNILPADYRKYYYFEKLNLDVSKLHYIVIENIPTYEENAGSVTNYIKWPKEEGFFIIGYFGTLEKERGLVELIGFIKKYNNLKLIIAGRGSLANYSEQVCDDEKITFLGEYNPSELIKLYSKIDFIWAYYSPSKNYIHYKYACPNKYYEHLYFKKPIIMNKYPYISKKINEIKSGIIIDDKLDDKTFKDLYENIINYRYDINVFSEWDKYENYKINL